MSNKSLIAAILVLGGALLVGFIILSGRTNQSGSQPSAQSSSGGIQHATDADFRQVVLQSSGRVLVDFYAQWCPPCKQLAPILEQISREHPQARIVKVDVDASRSTASQYGIQSIPTLIVFENGVPGQRQVGFTEKAQLQTMLGL